MMSKVLLTPNTTLYPVAVVLVTCGAEPDANLFTVNRIASCNAEPPMISISVRPLRASYRLIEELGEFVVNIPWPDMEIVTDYAGVTSAREVNKWQETGLTPLPATRVKPPLVAECPVNLECRVRHILTLPSHGLFVAEVVTLHADAAVLNERREVDLSLAGGGMVYGAAAVRERPVANFRPQELLGRLRSWRAAGG
jgi:flavin reductase (DIM6/NTAB) family NADH-FMN oxidoreductase RutF